MLVEAARNGRLAGLQALRDRLAQELDACGSARDVASLSQRLMDVLAQIEDLDPPRVEEKGTPLDELQKRRADRVSISKVARRAGS